MQMQQFTLAAGFLSSSSVLVAAGGAFLRSALFLALFFFFFFKGEGLTAKDEAAWAGVARRFLNLVAGPPSPRFATATAMSSSSSSADRVLRHGAPATPSGAGMSCPTSCRAGRGHARA